MIPLSGMAQALDAVAFLPALYMLWRDRKKGRAVTWRAVSLVGLVVLSGDLRSGIS